MSKSIQVKILPVEISMKIEEMLTTRIIYSGDLCTDNYGGLTICRTRTSDGSVLAIFASGVLATKTQYGRYRGYVEKDERTRINLNAW
jgi:hypothetical protein